MKTIAVANQKGGVGKTTTAVNLAGLLSERNQRVLLIDLDPQGSLSSYFKIAVDERFKGVAQLFNTEKVLTTPKLESCIVTTDFSNIDVMPGSISLATVDRQVSESRGLGLILSQALGLLEDKYDFVILDCPPVIGVLMINALAACDLLVIPTQTEHLAMNGLERMIDTLKMIEHSKQLKINFLIVPTLFDQRTRACHQALLQLKKLYPRELWQNTIPADTKLRDASIRGLPANYYSSCTRGVWAYQALLKQIILTLSKKSKVA